jgi:hypothetical protein
MDEKTLQPNEGFAGLQKNLNQLLEELRGWIESRLMPEKIAAE